HVTDALTHFERSQIKAFAHQLDFSLRWIQQSAEHFDSRCLAGPVCSKQPVNLAVTNLQIDVPHRREGSELLREIRRTQRDLAAHKYMVVPPWKGYFVNLMPQTPQRRDECIFKNRLIDLEFEDGQRGSRHFLFHCTLRLIRITHQEVETIAEPLDIN